MAKLPRTMNNFSNIISILLSRGKKNIGDNGTLSYYFCSVFRKNEKSFI